jgi:hypothetical protein
MNEFVVVYIINPLTQQVLYLKKNHGPKIILNKLIGFGGLIEESDKVQDKFQTIINATRRELKEELEEPLNKKLFAENHVFDYYGKIKIDNGILHILKTELNYTIQETNIPKEGELMYKPLDYHRSQPEDFPLGDVELLDKLFNLKK